MLLPDYDSAWRLHFTRMSAFPNTFFVDIYAKTEGERVLNIRRGQGRLCAESYGALRDNVIAGDRDPQNVSQRVILPSLSTGGPRYMFERQQDAMTYVRQVGKVGILITMATNLTWKEITKHLNRGQKAHDRPDLTVPVFRLKLQKLMTLFRTACFGKIQACLYPTEFQKRGLTHVHILLCKGNQDTTNHI